MENGFLRVPRGLFSSPAWQEHRRFSPAEAFLDLLQLAAWRSYSFYTKGVYVPVQPGELLTTSARLAKRWNWNRDDVRSWLRELRAVHALNGEVVEGLLKLSLPGVCDERFARIPATPPVPGPALNNNSSLSSSEEDLKNSSVSRSSEEHEQKNILISSSEERNSSEPEPLTATTPAPPHTSPPTATAPRTPAPHPASIPPSRSTPARVSTPAPQWLV